MRLTYNPTVFDRPSLAEAKQIILTPTAGRDTEDRWARETPYLADLLGRSLALRPGQLVVDYGCGVGRLAKALVEQFDCRVLGVDISTEMLALAPAYVGSPAFSAVSRSVFKALAASGLRADAAVSVWVLQHTQRPEDDIALLGRALRPGAGVAVVNCLMRCVPTVEHPWVSDGKDVRAMLAAAFGDGTNTRLDPEAVGDDVAKASYFALHRR